jgi:hypothetical protein
MYIFEREPCASLFQIPVGSQHTQKTENAPLLELVERKPRRIVVNVQKKEHGVNHRGRVGVEHGLEHNPRQRRVDGELHLLGHVQVELAVPVHGCKHGLFLAN